MDADDGGTDPGAADPSVLPPGPRRSTYVPPAVTTPSPGLFAEEAGTPRQPLRSPAPEPDEDDGALLSAFEAETAQLVASSTSQIADPAEAPPRPRLEDLPAPSGPPVLVPGEPGGADAAGGPAGAAPLGRHSAATEPDAPSQAAAPAVPAPRPPRIPRDWEPEVTGPIDRTSAAQDDLPAPTASMEPFAAPPPVVYELIEPTRPAGTLDLGALRETPVELPAPPAESMGAPFAPPTSAAPLDNSPADNSSVDNSPVDNSPVAGAPLVDPAINPGAVEQPREQDAADDFDRVLLTPSAAAGPAAVATGAPVVVEPRNPPAFVVEASGQEPTPRELRAGRGARLFWLWFAANSSVLTIAFGAVVFSLGMSLRQALVAVFLGVVASFVPLGLAARSGKWSGQPTMITSRATFGLRGNVVPSALAVLTRVFWGGVLLWLAGVAAARTLILSGLNGAFDERQLAAAVMALGFVLALGIAILGFGLIARIQLVLTIVSAVLVVGFIVLTWHAVDIGTALTVTDGPWTLVVTGIVLVFSFLGLVWATSGSDLARYQRPASSGAAAMVWSPLGTVAAPLVLIAYGAVLSASDRDLASGLVRDPVQAIASLLPSWYPLPLLAAIALSLISGVTISLYSGGLSLQALGLRVHRSVASVIVGVLVLAVSILIWVGSLGVLAVFRDLATTLAVPIAAWAGIMTAELMLRRRRFDSASLITRGGVYRDVNWVNLGALVVATAIGYGLTSATVAGLAWQGYLFRLAGVELRSDLGATDVGVLVALALGALTPFVAGVRAVRAQERATPPTSPRPGDLAQN